MSNFSDGSIGNATLDVSLPPDYREHMDQPEKSIDSLWVAMSIVLVFAMQMGFALLESGSVRIINRKSTLLKNVIDISVTIIAWILCGGYIVQGEHGYGNPEGNALGSARGLFDLMFACNTATIISGAVTERISIFGYISITVVVSGFIYPVVVLTVWTEHGFLKQWGYVDFAGSSVVHVVGGVVGIVCAWRLGPRTFGVPEEWALPASPTVSELESNERSNAPNSEAATRTASSARWRRKLRRGTSEDNRSKEGSSNSPRTKSKVEKLIQILESRIKFIERSHYGMTTFTPMTRFTRFERPDLDAKEFQGNCPAFVVIGTFMLWYGFYGFNAGSANISGESAGVVVRVMWNTTMSAVGGQFAALLLCVRVRRTPQFKMWFEMGPDIIMTMCNATIAGLVSASAGSDRESGLNAFVTGVAGGILMSCLSSAAVSCQIDDPLDAGAVHLGGGAAGTLLCGLLPQPDIDLGGQAPRKTVFPIQLLGIAMIVSWSAIAALIVAETLKRVHLLRVSNACEEVGFDVWLQQSFLPPPAPDILTQLPNFKSNDSGGWTKRNKGKAVSQNSLDSVEEVYDANELEIGRALRQRYEEHCGRALRQIPQVGHDLRAPQQAASPQTSSSTMTASPLAEVHSSSSELMVEHISLDTWNHQQLNGLVPSQELDFDLEHAVPSQELDFDLEYSLHQKSVQEQYEEELQAMCALSEAREGDVESMRSQDLAGLSDRSASKETALSVDKGVVTSV